MLGRYLLLGTLAYLALGKFDRLDTTIYQEDDFNQALKEESITTTTGIPLTLRFKTNPTTGYEWFISQIDDLTGIVELVGDEIEPPASKMMGAPSYRVLKFIAKKLGTHTLTILYKKRWVGEPLSTFVLKLKTIGFEKTIIKEGNGINKPKKGDKLTMHYTGYLDDDSVFDSSVKRGQPFTFTIGVGQVIKGWEEGIMTMFLGERAYLKCSPEYAYGARGHPPVIPRAATLTFEVQLLKINQFS